MGNNYGSRLCATDANGHEHWRRRLKRSLQKNFPTNCSCGKVIGISACYYASQAAGIQKEEELSINAAVERLQKKHSQLVPQLDEKLASGKDVQERLKKNKRFFVTLSNVTIQMCLLTTVFSADMKVSYHRDWKHPVPGEPDKTINFRTTWTAGWFIGMLKNHGYNLVRDVHLEVEEDF